MPDDDHQPQIWTAGSGSSILATVALAALFVAFFVLSLVRHFGVRALAFGGLGALLMAALAWLQWREIKRRTGG